jgi:hypothetical protein
VAWSASSWSAWFCFRVETLAYAASMLISRNSLVRAASEKTVSRDSYGRTTSVPGQLSCSYLFDLSQTDIYGPLGQFKEVIDKLHQADVLLLQAM